MTSQDDLALLKQMYQRGEITDGQYDVLRRHVLWGTPLPQLMDDIPAPRSEPAPRRAPDPPARRVGSPLDPAGYVAGSSTVGPRPGGYPATDLAGPAASPRPAPDRSGPAPFPPPGAYPAVGDARYPRGWPEPGRPAPAPPDPGRPVPTPPDPGRPVPTPPDPGDRYSGEPGSSPAGAPEPGRRRYASRRERRQAEEADHSPSTYLPPTADHYPAAADHYPPTADHYPAAADRYPADGNPADGYPAPIDGYPAAADGYPAPGDGPVRPRRSRRHGRDDPDEADGAPALPGSPPPPQDDLGEYAPSAYRTPLDERWQAAPIAYDPTVYPRGRRHQDDPPDDELTDRRARRSTEADPPDERERDADRRAAGRRPRRRSLVAVLTSLALALALAAGGVYWFVLRTNGVPPTTYAREACGSVRDWQQAVDSSNTTLVNGIARQQDGAKIRAAVTAYYTTVARRTDQLRTAILGLGVADIAGGQQYGDSLAAAVGDQATALRTLADRAGRLDPAAATFQAQLHDLLTGADSAVSAVSGALARPAAGISTELRSTLSDEPACAPYVG